MLGALALAAWAAAAPDPYAIYAQARARWQSQSYPAFLTYRVTISGADGTGTVTNTYGSSTDTATNAIAVTATSVEESAHPYTPHGVTLQSKISISYAGKPVLGKAPSVDPTGIVHVSRVMPISNQQQYDLLGVPVLSPTYSFGLAPAGAPSRSAAQAVRLQTVLPTIASVIAVRRDYVIRYEGLESIDGIACYHLALAALRDPATFRLRALWIEKDSYYTRRALVQGNFTQGPGPRLPWLVRFNRSGPLIYIADETAVGTVKYLGHVYANVTVRFSDVLPSANPPSPTWALSMFRTSGDVLREP